ncbi:hypothetical protein [Lysinibacillus fusiformis]|uniref:Uncharacterized protein n=1 Tax=Lysinibacillus fusiformis TaxID=28031 RepID=A0A1E4R7A1_9BACI|nr:hypothetical protein [Lysinibacillus fusiformis]ODV56319.1 hypothetical protein BG258_10605 [Lysinibacillus fusiformis]
MKELAEEHGFSYEGLNPNLTNEDMYLQYQKRQQAKDTFTNDLKNEMTQHSTELQEVIETQLVGDENDQSFLTKKEVEQLISVHFNRIEKGLGHLVESME